jgi:hypothetical protein
MRDRRIAKRRVAPVLRELASGEVVPRAPRTALAAGGQLEGPPWPSAVPGTRVMAAVKVVPRSSPEEAVAAPSIR